MFGLFSDPFDILSYRPKYVARVYDPFYGYEKQPSRRVYDPFGINSLNAYMQAMGQIFNNLFGYEDQEEEQRDEKEKKEENVPTNEKQDQNENQEKKEQDQKEEEQNKESIKIDKAAKPQYWSHSSVFSSHSHGGIEEIREKTFDSRTGETVESQTRRIGDRWCRMDSITDKEGVTKNKETWHNVANEEIEDFKKEWVSRRGLKAQDQKALAEKKNEQETDEKIEKKDEQTDEKIEKKDEQTDEKIEKKDEQTDEKIEEKDEQIDEEQNQENIEENPNKND